jgi:phosphopantothenoylcysteine decarboxylase/phosphopantothenate--cysteine ligase
MILVGVCGGIAAYKTCELVRLLVRSGHDVQVVQTAAAERFVGPTTFAALSRRPVLTEKSDDVFPHLDASRHAELLCIAPLTATSLARVAHGEASSLLAATALAFVGPIVAAPAMNPRMWDAPETQANLGLLRSRRFELVGPEQGEMAEGEMGTGRMAEPETIAAAVERRLETARSMEGLRVLVTAGGTREPIDAVRYVGNRSSGRMGVAVADEAAWRGAEVTLVLAAAMTRPSAPMTTVHVETAADMRDATLEHAARSDVVVMAAAVADYRPARPVEGKRPKDAQTWTLELEPTADVLEELGRSRSGETLLVGFAAEHGQGALERARAKRDRKRIDAVIVNDVSRAGIGFDADDNEIVIVSSNGERRISKRSKRECAAAIWDTLAPAGNRLAPAPVPT